MAQFTRPTPAVSPQTRDPGRIESARLVIQAGADTHHQAARGLARAITAGMRHGVTLHDLLHWLPGWDAGDILALLDSFPEDV